MLTSPGVITNAYATIRKQSSHSVGLPVSRVCVCAEGGGGEYLGEGADEMGAINFVALECNKYQ